MALETYKEKERFITSKAKCTMTGMKLKVKKVIRKGSSIRYFVNNLESLTDVEACRSTPYCRSILGISSVVLCDAEVVAFW